MSNTITYRVSGAFLLALWALSGCQSSPPDPGTSRELATDVDVDVKAPESDESDAITLEDPPSPMDLSSLAGTPRGLVARLASGQWSERKLAQRELTQLPEGPIRDDLAGRLIDGAMDEAGEEGADRVATAALRLSPNAAIARISSRLSALGDNEGHDTVSRFMILMVRADENGLSRAHADTLTPIAVDAVARRDDPRSVAAGLSMLAHLQDPRVTELVQDITTAPEKALRKTAYSVLQRWEIPGGLSIALQAIDDPATYVRRRAVAALGLYGQDAEAVKALTTVLRTESDSRVCTRAIEALARLQSDVAEPLLLERLDADDGCGASHRFVTLASARRALRRSDQPMTQLRTRLRELADGPPAQGLKASAIVALGDVQAASALEHDDAIFALGELTSPSLESKTTRVDAVTALATMPQTEARRRIFRMLEHVSLETEVLATTLELLETHPAEEVTNMVSLVPYTGVRESPEIRRRATRVISRGANDEDSAARLAALTGDEDGDVARTAHTGALRLLGTEAGTSPASYAAALSRVRVRAEQDRIESDQATQPTLAAAHTGPTPQMKAEVDSARVEHLHAKGMRSPGPLPVRPETLSEFEVPDDPMKPQ